MAAAIDLQPLPVGIIHPADKTIGVFVALADPKHTGIEQLPLSIGDGDNAGTNLYWGNDEGVRGVFDRSRKWKLVDQKETPQAELVLSRRVYRRIGGNMVLIAHAFRGAAMKQCIQAYEDAVAHGRYDLVVFVGHDGLMDTWQPGPLKAPDQKKTPDCAALCCLSEEFMAKRLQAAGGHSILLTTQRMYPGAFILEAILDPWNAGKGTKDLRESAATAYAQNQKISTRAALGVFTELK
ncbi:MAG: hypothetical protein QM796_03020 [Chthoniobacteraceae bacterium]